MERFLNVNMVSQISPEVLFKKVKNGGAHSKLVEEWAHRSV